MSRKGGRARTVADGPKGWWARTVAGEPKGW